MAANLRLQRATASGDREELLPPLDTQQGTENPCRSKDIRDGGVASTYKFPGALTPKLFSLIPWQSIVLIY